MRIIIIGPAYPYRGGIADTNESLCRALVELGHETSIITFTAQYPKLLFPGKTQFAEGAAPEGLNIERSIHSYNPLSWGASAKAILAQKPDLVIFRFWTPFISMAYSALANRMRGKCTLIGMVDNAIPHEASFIDKRFTNSFLCKMQGVTCLSQYVARQVREMVNIPVTSYPHPINTNLGERMERGEAVRKLGLDDGKHYILFFGLIRRYKGLDFLLESMALLKDKLPDLRLIIAGEFYDDKQPYLDRINKLGINERVMVHDRFIPKEDVSTYFSAVELLTLTYRSATQSGVTQIGMHYDLPMLVTDVGALGEYVRHDVMGYVVPREPPHIAAAIEDFFVEKRYVEMSHAVANEKVRYDWKSFSNELLRFSSEM